MNETNKIHTNSNKPQNIISQKRKQRGRWLNSQKESFILFIMWRMEEQNKRDSRGLYSRFPGKMMSLWIRNISYVCLSVLRVCMFSHIKLYLSSLCCWTQTSRHCRRRLMTDGRFTAADSFCPHRFITSQTKTLKGNLCSQICKFVYVLSVCVRLSHYMYQHALCMRPEQLREFLWLPCCCGCMKTKWNILFLLLDFLLDIFT